MKRRQRALKHGFRCSPIASRSVSPSYTILEPFSRSLLTRRTSSRASSTCDSCSCSPCAVRDSADAEIKCDEAMNFYDSSRSPRRICAATELSREERIFSEVSRLSSQLGITVEETTREFTKYGGDMCTLKEFFNSNSPDNEELLFGISHVGRCDTSNYFACANTLKDEQASESIADKSPQLASISHAGQHDGSQQQMAQLHKALLSTHKDGSTLEKACDDEYLSHCGACTCEDCHEIRHLERVYLMMVAGPEERRRSARVEQCREKDTRTGSSFFSESVAIQYS